jgi:hypothetical protein
MLNKYLQYFSSKLLAKSYNYNDWREQNFKLQKIKLPNTDLTKDLARLCKEKGGILTFGEFISAEMFGKNGYYNTHKDFGKTTVAKIWPKAIINLCKKFSLRSVVEVGSGDGSLGRETLKVATREKFNLNWTGIEINESLWKEIKKSKIRNFLLSKSIRELKPQKSLTIFSYSLDSMPSEVVINYNPKKGCATTLLGIKIENGFLEEVLLSKNDLKRRGIAFQNGVLKIRNYSFNFSSWILYPNQRAYIPIEGFLAILDCIQKMKRSSSLFIIDEVKVPPLSSQNYHLGTPRILNSPIRDYEILTDAYRNVGNNLWYFPMYLKPLLEFIKEVGFDNVKFDIEERMASNIKGEHWNKPGYHLCISVLANFVNISLKNSFTIPSPS